MRVITVSGKQVHTGMVYWDPAHGCYFVRGAYGKKDGTRGKRPAHTVLLAGEVPADVHKAIQAAMSTPEPEPTPEPAVEDAEPTPDPTPAVDDTVATSVGRLRRAAAARRDQLAAWERSLSATSARDAAAHAEVADKARRAHREAMTRYWEGVAHDNLQALEPIRRAAEAGDVAAVEAGDVAAVEPEPTPEPAVEPEPMPVPGDSLSTSVGHLRRAVEAKRDQLAAWEGYWSAASARDAAPLPAVAAESHRAHREAMSRYWAGVSQANLPDLEHIRRAAEAGDVAGVEDLEYSLEVAGLLVRLGE
jgi:hypothetical protein